MSADRELLELAAKAAGVEIIAMNEMGDGRCNPMMRVDRSVASAGITLWNPLTDDGDALRLAVTLGLMVFAGMGCSGDMVTIKHDDLDDSPFERYGSDSFAATRRAIVRAAAEIGRAMQ